MRNVIQLRLLGPMIKKTNEFVFTCLLYKNNFILHYKIRYAKTRSI